MDQELEGLTSVYALGLPLYREAQWPSILPIPPSMKKSPPEGFTGGTDRVPTEDEYVEWATKQPHWNIALRLPDGVIGIDIDDYGTKTGLMNLENFAIDLELPALPSTWMSSSRDGGSGIYLVRVPTGHRFVSSPCRDVEIIQSGHRYMLVFPSVHPRSTDRTMAQYQWRDRSGQIVDRVPRIDELALLPIPWVEALTSHPGVGSNGSSSGGGGSVGWWTQDRIDEWIAERDAAFRSRDWAKMFANNVERMVADASSGTRHDAIVRATGSVVSRIEMGAMPGSALYRLADEARSLYEGGCPAGKVPKPWVGDNEVEFWTAAGGAIAKDNEEGHPWYESLQPAREAEQIAEWLEENPLEVEEPPESPETPPEEPPTEPEPEPVEAPPAPQEPPIPPAQAVAAAAEHVVAVRADTDAEVRQTELVLRAAEIQSWIGNQGRVGEVIGQAAIIMGVDYDAVRLMSSPPIEFPRSIHQDRWDEIHLEAVQMVADKRSVMRGFVAEVLPHWVEGDWLPKGVLAALVAPPSVGKTLWAVDLACRLTMGMEWFGEVVERCPVLYLAHEAHASASQRVVAWCQGHADDMMAINARVAAAGGENLMRPDGSPLGLVMVPMTGSLRTEGGRATVRMHAETMAGAGGPPGVVIIDTLAAGFGEGEENSPRDMGAFLDSCNQLMIDLPGLTFLILHHPVKDAFAKPGEFHTGRGSGALKGSISVEWACRRIEIEGVDTGMVEVARLKARDGEQGVQVSRKAIRRIHRLAGPDGAPLRRSDGNPATSVFLGEATDDEIQRIAAMSLADQSLAFTNEYIKVYAAVSALRESGENPTHRKVQDWCKKHHGSGVGANRLKDYLDQAKAALDAAEQPAPPIVEPDDDL